jgi:acyl carrier protein
MNIAKVIIPAALVIPCSVVAQDKQDDVKQTENSKPVSRGEIEKRVIKIISTKLGVPLNNIKGNMKFESDLGADSLDIVEMIMSMEKEFHISISDTLAEKAVTVENAVTIVDGILNVKHTEGNIPEKDTIVIHSQSDRVKSRKKIK